MTEKLPHSEPLNIDPERLRRITDVVAKIRFRHRLEEEMGDDTLPDFTGLDYDTSRDVYNAISNGLLPGSTREDVELVMRQVDKRIEEGGGLDAYLAAETERRMDKERERLEQRQSADVNTATVEPQPEEALPSSNPNQETRRGFGRSILRRLTKG